MKLIVAALVFLCAASNAGAQPQSRPLIQPSDFGYAGSFQVPTGDSAGCNGVTRSHCFTYGGTALSYNPARNSLFFGGHDWIQQLGEIGIPSDFSTTAPVLQDLADVTDGALGAFGSPTNKLAGTLVYNNRLIVTGVVYYGANQQFKSHGASGLDLSNPGDFTGFTSTNTAQPRGVSGWMTTIPAEWQSLLGGPALTGNCCYPGNQDTSNGPAAIVFNPNDVGNVNPIPGTTVLYYPFAHPIANYASGNQYYNLATVIRGIAFPNGSRSVLFIGRQGTGPYCYGPGTSNPALGGTPSGNGVDPWCYDPTDGAKGTHSYPYRHQVWAYDANDLLAVKNGSKQSWEIMPYAVWGLNEMDSSGGAKIRGAAFDPASGRLYITQDYGENPTVDVYQITVSGKPLPPETPSVTLSASPASVPPGGSTTLTWSSTNATGCTASGAWSGARAVSGSQSTGALNSKSSTFTITCAGAGGSARATVALGSSSTVNLAIVKSGDGAGTVTSSTVGISCGTDCSEPYSKGASVTLTATAASGSVFSGWSGACSGTGSCTVSLKKSTSVAAKFSDSTPDAIGVFRPATGEWFLDRNGNGKLDGCGVDACIANFGQPGDLPVAGPWTGAQTTLPGVFDPDTATWYLDSNGNSTLDGCELDACKHVFGQPGDVPVVGDWTGSGQTRIGVFRPGTRQWYFDINNNGSLDACKKADLCTKSFGSFGDVPVVGDWTGSGRTKIGVYRPGTGQWFLDLNGDQKIDKHCNKDLCVISFGQAGDIPVVGDWDGGGADNIGVFRPSTGDWLLDSNGNGVWDGCNIDTCLKFGQPGDLPVAGRW